MATTTAPQAALTQKMLIERAHLARNRAFGVAFIVIALAIYWFFALGVEAELVSTFGLNQGAVPAAERLPDWVIPSYGTSALLAVLSAAIGAYQLARGGGK